jgi:hypothetical protein
MSSVMAATFGAPRSSQVLPSVIHHLHTSTSPIDEGMGERGALFGAFAVARVVDSDDNTDQEHASEDSNGHE